MPLFLKILFGLVSVAYPVLVFACLVVFRVPLRIFSLFVVFLGLLYLIFATGGDKKRNAKLFVSAGLLLFAGLFCLFTGRSLFIKLYPVLMNGIFLFTFAVTLFTPPNICFRLACLSDKKLKNSFISKRVESYCGKVTLVWCAFFVLNGILAAFTVFFGSDRLWSIYNGGVSYVLMGILFSVEFLVRKVVNSKMPKSVPISKFSSKSRKMGEILCFEGKWSDKKYLTWFDFLRDSAKIRKFLDSKKCEKWILHVDDGYFFLCALVALLQRRRQLLITANVAENYIEEIRETASTDSPSEPAANKGLKPLDSSDSAKIVGFLTDIEGIPDSDLVSDVLASVSVSDGEISDTPKIDPDDTKIVLYTSGSTGKPKAVLQRLTEFEADNAFVIKKWGEEFLSRKLVSTVSQHHIYGFLFSVCLPFTLSVPFRRRRIEFPQEFENLSDEKYMIIATPAFLKRTCAEFGSLPLKSPWIFTSGGAVSPELSVDTEKTFGFCPLEVYGSTETSGIAFRQQKIDGLFWTPFDNAKIWLDEADGCLTIISPYIKDPAGFKTGDLAEFQADGRFLLKGRADSIVKIEEKRISIPEVESRLYESGWVSDCSVVALSDRRQYLAAVVVLSEKGRGEFANLEKFEVNRRFHDFLMRYFENVVIPKKWRFVEKIPSDIQGKKHKDEIRAMFD